MFGNGVICLGGGGEGLATGILEGAFAPLRPPPGLNPGFSIAIQLVTIATCSMYMLQYNCTLSYMMLSEM